jgi:hypothetical protein
MVSTDVLIPWLSLVYLLALTVNECLSIYHNWPRN